MHLALVDRTRSETASEQRLTFPHPKTVPAAVVVPAAVIEFIFLVVIALLLHAVDAVHRGASTGLGDGGWGADRYAVTTVAGALVIVGANALVGLYDPRLLCNTGGWISRLAIAATLTTMIVVFGTLLRDGATLPPGLLALWFVVSLAALVGERLLMARWLRRQAAAGRFHRNVLVVEAGESGAAFLQSVHRQASGHSPNNQDPQAEFQVGAMQIVGIVDVLAAGDSLDGAMPAAPAALAGHPILGGAGELWRHARDRAATDIVIAVPWTDPMLLWDTVRAAAMAPVNVHLLLGPFRHDPPVLLEVVRSPMRGWNAGLKRAEDVILAGLLLALLLPLLLLIACAIRLDSPGPVLFRQKRFGFNNQPFDVFKFRTMHTDREDASGTQRTVRHDPRVTRLGRFLRRSSLDELPQLFNVLRGDMSLVGPRAHPLTMVAGETPFHEAVPGYFARHRVRPGMTGLAQIRGLRGEVDTLEKGQQRIACDLMYIDNLSVLLDLKILALTPLCLVRNTDVY